MGDRFFNYFSDNIAFQRNIKRIDEDDSKRILLVGNGTGRSKLTYALNNDSNLLNPNILNYYYIRSQVLSSKHIYCDSYNGSDRRAEDTQIELEMATRILYKIMASGYYSKLDTKTKKVDKLVSDYYDQFLDWYRNENKDDETYHDVELFEYSELLMEKLKKLIGTKQTTLILDDFDIANNSSKYTQERYSKYFDLFDRVVLVCNDPSVYDKGVKLDYLYSEVFDMIRNRLSNRYFNECDKYYEEFNKIVTFENVRLLHRRFNGNMKMIVEVLIDAIENGTNLSNCSIKKEDNIRRRVPKLYV